MLVIFHSTTETKILDGTYVTLFSSRLNKGQRQLIIKGKLGQFRLFFHLGQDENIHQTAITQSAKRRETTILLGSTEGTIFKKEKRIFIYDKKHNKLLDLSRACARIENVSPTGTPLNTKTRDHGRNIYEDFQRPKEEQLREAIYLQCAPRHKEQNVSSEDAQAHRREATMAAQLQQIMIGVSQGFTMNLELRGIGYQAKIVDNMSPKGTKSKEFGGARPRALETFVGFLLFGVSVDSQKLTYTINSGTRYLSLDLGWSHNPIYVIPKVDVTMNIIGTPTGAGPTITISGISKSKVNQVAAEIYRYKKPEPYKGKGIRYDGEKFFEKRRARKG